MKLNGKDREYLRALIKLLDDDGLNEVFQILKEEIGRRESEVFNGIEEGIRVEFFSDTHKKTVRGMVVSLNRKTVTVVDDNGDKWYVPPILLKKVNETPKYVGFDGWIHGQGDDKRIKVDFTTPVSDVEMAVCMAVDELYKRGSIDLLDFVLIKGDGSVKKLTRGQMSKYIRNVYLLL